MKRNRLLQETVFRSPDRSGAVVLIDQLDKFYLMGTLGAQKEVSSTHTTEFVRTMS